MYNLKMLPQNTFKDRVILITGGGTGLGKSIGEYILELGGSLIITSRKKDVLEKTTKEFDEKYPDKRLEFDDISDVNERLAFTVKCKDEINILEEN